MRRFSKYLFVFLLMAISWVAVVLLSTLNGWWHKPVTNNKDSKAFSEEVNQKVNKEFVGNFAMALFKGGEVEQEFFFSNHKAVDKNTIFQVSSLSKFVSAMGVLKLAELGTINLDTPINRYLKRWQLPPSPFNNNEVTARKLLSHTAGLTDELGYSGFENRDSVQTLESSLTKAKDADEGASGEVKVGMEPGSRWKYSGGGFTLLQLLVEETSGQSFDSFMKETVFKPLNMSSSTYVWNDSLNYMLCEFYEADGSKTSHRYYTSLAATSLYTSLADLEKFFQLFFAKGSDEPIGRGILNPSTLKLMREPQWDIMGEGIYGLGCMLYIDIAKNEFIFGHDGSSTPPVNTAIRINPVSGDGIIILETGHKDLATKIASDWVFLETGKTDTLLFLMLFPQMVRITTIGLLAMIVLSIATFFVRRKKVG